MLAGSGETTMAPTDKKRLLLLCGTSLLTLQLIAVPVGFSTDGAGLALQAAEAQETSCFVAGTLVLMADGSQQPIETLRPGDAVLGRRGRVNRVVACERTPLGRRRLYALNGRQPFVTAEHPFLTTEGWKALDPEATRRENDHLHVAALQLGDRLCRGIARRIGGPGGPAETERGLLFLQSATALEALSAVEADPQTPLFNLLLDGDHSYVADGWIVHNKEGGSDGGGSDGGGSDGGGSDGGGSDGGGSDGGGSDGGGSDGGGSDGGGSDGGGSDGGGSDGGGSDGGGSDGGGSDGGGSDGGGSDGGGSDGGGSDGGGSDGGGSDGGGSDGGGSDGGSAPTVAAPTVGWRSDGGGSDGGGSDGGGSDGGGSDGGGSDGGGSDGGGRLRRRWLRRWRLRRWWLGRWRLRRRWLGRRRLRGGGRLRWQTARTVAGPTTVGRMAVIRAAAPMLATRKVTAGMRATPVAPAPTMAGRMAELLGARGPMLLEARVRPVPRRVQLNGLRRPHPGRSVLPPLARLRRRPHANRQVPARVQAGRRRTGRHRHGRCWIPS